MQPRQHFGNGTLITIASLPPHPADHASLAAAIRLAVDAGAAAAQLAQPADAHFASWWHPLQFDLPLDFGLATDDGSPSTSFTSGPSTLAICARLCAIAGHPNLTVLPAADGGLALSLRAPLKSAHGVAELLRKRSKAVDGFVAFVANAAATYADALPPPAPPRLLPANPANLATTATAPPPQPVTASRPAAATLQPPALQPPAIPAGHTAFSWLHGADDQPVPPSHTAFSWGGLTPQHHPSSLQAPSSLPLHPSAPPLLVSESGASEPGAAGECALLWLHGLGDTGVGWRGKFHGLDQIAGLRCHHPTAAVRAVRALGGERVTAWFELHTYPVGLNEPQVEVRAEEDEGEMRVGLDGDAADASSDGTHPPANRSVAEMVQCVHGLLDQLVAAGTPSERIVLGGFSMGGTAALLAGLSYRRPLAGIASISSWCVHRSPTVLSRAVRDCNSRVPILFSAGTTDPVVAFRLAKQSAEALVAALPNARIIFERIDRTTHPPKRKEMQAVTEFIRSCLLDSASASPRPLLPPPPPKSEPLPTSKGERALLGAPAPNVAAELPAMLRRQARLRFDPAVHDLYGAVVALLRSLGDGFGVFPANADDADDKAGSKSSASERGAGEGGGSGSVGGVAGGGVAASKVPRGLLESYRPCSGAGVFTSFRLRQQLYTAAGRHETLLAAYDQLVMKVVLPFLKARLAEAAEFAGDASRQQQQQEQQQQQQQQQHQQHQRPELRDFYYQRPPSLRLQPHDVSAFCRAHRDAEYGHQVGEVNFWMQLTDPEQTQTTLWVESEPGSADYRPLHVAREEIAAFHGTLCMHHVPPNTSPCTRVSLDFRVGIGGYFDPNWTLREAKAQHTRRHVVL